VANQNANVHGSQRRVREVTKWRKRESEENVTKVTASISEGTGGHQREFEGVLGNIELRRETWEEVNQVYPQGHKKL
jgi:hypothetical protein